MKLGSCQAGLQSIMLGHACAVKMSSLAHITNTCLQYSLFVSIRLLAIEHRAVLCVHMSKPYGLQSTDCIMLVQSRWLIHQSHKHTDSSYNG